MIKGGTGGQQLLYNQYITTPIAPASVSSSTIKNASILGSGILDDFLLAADLSGNVFLYSFYNAPFMFVKDVSNNINPVYYGYSGGTGGLIGGGTTNKRMRSLTVSPDSQYLFAVFDNTNPFSIIAAKIVAPNASGTFYKVNSGTTNLSSRMFGMVFDRNGYLYLTSNDTATNYILKSDNTYYVNSSAITFNIFAGNTSTNGRTDGLGSAAAFNGAWDICCDSSGNLYVIDDGYIRVILPNSYVFTYGACPNNFRNNAITIDGSGNVFSLSINNKCIFMVNNYSIQNMIKFELQTNTSTSSNSSGVVLFIAGNTSIAGTTDSTIAAGYLTNSSNTNNIRFTTPERLCSDIFNNIYILDNQGSIPTQAALRVIQFNNISSILVDRTPPLYGYTYDNFVTVPPGLNSTGNIAINGINSSGYTLNVYGNINATGVITAPVITQTSDIRVKENIRTIESSLDIINKLRGVYYTQIGDSTQRRHMGLIAQEVETHIPEIVWTNSSEKNIKSVAYGNIVSILIEGIKELDKQTENKVIRLESQIQSLQSTINSLTNTTTATE